LNQVAACLFDFPDSLQSNTISPIPGSFSLSDLAFIAIAIAIARSAGLC
jgi:hypothetical protein